MAGQRIFDMAFSKVYPMLVQKAERKCRTKAEVYEVTSWLTGYTLEQIDSALASDLTYGAFFSQAPAWNPRSDDHAENVTFEPGFKQGARVMHPGSNKKMHPGAESAGVKWKKVSLH